MRSPMPAAAAIKRWGKGGDYQQLRRLTLRRFADSTNPGIAAQALKVVMLEPVEEELFPTIAPLVDTLRSYLDAPPENESLYIIPWRRFSLALFHYRRGELNEALVHSKTSLSDQLNARPLVASNQLLQAMILHRQGRHDEARPAFDEGCRLIEAWESAPFSLGVSYDLWFDWENARFLRDEASRLMEVS